MQSGGSLLFKASAAVYCSAGKHSPNKMIILIDCLHFEHASAAAAQRAHDCFPGAT